MLAVIIAVCVVAVAVGERDVVSLDFGWRVADAHSLTPPTCSFPISLSGVRCMNLAAASAVDAVSCAAAACTQGAQVWQFAESEGGCWVGDLSDCDNAGPDAAWVGAGTNASGAPPADAPPAQRNYDDSSWLFVDTPHDATIVGNFSKSDNQGEAFLPPAISYYRKHFRAPAAWAGSVVTIELDASLSTSTFWLNGAQLIVAKPNGYLPLVLRLDNAGLNFSDTLDNIFVAFVDGRCVHRCALSCPLSPLSCPSVVLLSERLQLPAATSFPFSSIDVVKRRAGGTRAAVLFAIHA